MRCYINKNKSILYYRILNKILKLKQTLKFNLFQLNNGVTIYKKGKSKFKFNKRFIKIGYYNKYTVSLLNYNLLNFNFYSGYFIAKDLSAYIILNNMCESKSDLLYIDDKFFIKNLYDYISNYYGACLTVSYEGYSQVINAKESFVNGSSVSYFDTKGKSVALMEYIERTCAKHKLEDCVFETLDNLKKKYPNISFLDLSNYEILDNKIENEIMWCKGKSLFSNKYKFMPMQLFQYLQIGKGRPLTEASSNGAAISTSFMGSLLYGLYEAIERDILIRFWKGEIKEIKKLIIDNNKNFELKELYLKDLGFELTFYIIEKDGLNTIWCLIKNMNSNLPIYTASGFGSGISIKDSIQSAFKEAFGIILQFKANLKTWKEKFHKIEGSNKIYEAEDIIYYFASKKVKPIFDKIDLMCSEILLSSYERNNKNFESIEEELEYFINLLKDRYKDVVFIEQSTNDLLGFNLRCCKVILEGGFEPTFVKKIDELEGPFGNVYPLA